MLIPKGLFKVATLFLLLIANYFVALEAFALYPNTSHVNAVRCIDKERQALLKFKDSLEDPGSLLSSWFGSDCCTWKGVGCRYPTGEVIKLHLGNPKDYDIALCLTNSSLCLGGKLSHYLDELEHLSYLNLSYNSFSGMIPPQLGNLSNLRVLDLSRVGYDSYVSDLNWISGLSSLKFLDLSGINLSLATTHWLQAINNIPSLVELHLPSTWLQSVPVFLSHSNLTSLSVLDLSYNNFSTQAPQWLINISTGVVVLKLSYCHFRGPISSLFGGSLFRYNHNYNLEELVLSYNEFSGELPDSFGHLKSLRTLDLFLNSISGPLPTSVGMLSKLEILGLRYNKMNGSIPKSLGRLGELKILDLSYNDQWEGILSQDHFQGLSKLKELYISSRNGAFDLNNLSRNWVPPFSLEVILIENQDLGPEFPAWLQTQTQLVQIYLSNVSISDTIPSWLWKLSPRIQHLDLSQNQLRGTIPTSLVFPSNAVIYLSSNFLHGRLPLWQNVSYLLLDNNTFSGPIPVKIGQIMSSLIYLDLSGNLLNGSIPSSVGKMDNLNFLFLSNNQLSGKVHDNWMNKFIVSIDLSNNNLSGNFPTSLCSLPELAELKLSNNALFGKLPSSVKNYKILRLLDMGENKFSGSIPKWIGENHLSLKELRMRGNLFNGSISEQLCGLQSLHVLDLAQNNFSGPIPTCLSHLNGMKSRDDTTNMEVVNMDLNLKGIEYTYNRNMLRFVRLIDLSCNNLTGFLAEDITNLVGLGTLNLSNNHLTGKIPSRIGEMQYLETLDLSSNHFYGQIPPSMSSMTFLVHLNLSHNNLSGRIPLGNQFSTFNESVYEGNSGLCGFPLPKCGIQEEGGDDHDEDGDEEDDGKLGLYVSVALGFTFGFWSICGSLVIKKSWRDAYYGFLDKTKDRIMIVVALNLNRLRRMIARMGN